MDDVGEKPLTIAAPRLVRALFCYRCIMALGLFFSTPSRAATQTIPLNILYIHGVKGGTADRQNAQYSLDELEAAINAEIGSRIQAYQTANPGTTITFRSARAKLYTATPSAYHPSDSLGPLFMDDWEIGDPGCATTKQGQPCTTAYEWRYRLAREIESKFPADAKNIILVGHSTGGRASRYRARTKRATVPAGALSYRSHESIRLSCRVGSRVAPGVADGSGVYQLSD